MLVCVVQDTPDCAFWLLHTVCFFLNNSSLIQFVFYYHRLRCLCSFVDQGRTRWLTWKRFQKRRGWRGKHELHELAENTMYPGAAWLLMGCFGRHWPLVGPGTIISSQAIKTEAKAGACSEVFPQAWRSCLPCTSVQWPLVSKGGFPWTDRGGVPVGQGCAPQGTSLHGPHHTTAKLLSCAVWLGLGNIHGHS